MSPAGRWGTARPTWCWNGWSIRIRRHRITSYLTRTPDGKVLKSSTIYIQNSRGR